MIDYSSAEFFSKNIKNLNIHKLLRLILCHAYAQGVREGHIYRTLVFELERGRIDQNILKKKATMYKYAVNFAYTYHRQDVIRKCVLSEASFTTTSKIRTRSNYPLYTPVTCWKGAFVILWYRCRVYLVCLILFLMGNVVCICCRP